MRIRVVGCSNFNEIYYLEESTGGWIIRSVTFMITTSTAASIL